MANEPSNTAERPEPTPADHRINADPTDKERMEREADKLAHQANERESHFDNSQKPFTK